MPDASHIMTRHPVGVRHFGIVSFVSILYWAYLVFVTQPILVHDAQGYRDIGGVVYEKGALEYFRTGPNREPVYPFLVAAAMRLADMVSCSYESALKVFQIFILFLTQLLTFLLLQRMGISRLPTLLILFYIGFSPGLVNSALSVFSEIATYPFVLGIVLLSAAAWEMVQQEKKIFPIGVALGLVFAGMTLIKGIYEMIFPVFLLPFLYLGIRAYRNNRRIFSNTVLFLVVTVLTFQFCIMSYKCLNKKYNGLFRLTDRGAWALYGNTARRMETMTPKRVAAGLAYNVLEMDSCSSLLGREECSFWDLPYSDRLAREKNYEVMSTVPREQWDSRLLAASLEKILQNPFQYLALLSFDWIHMFFWESTRIGFVVYPDWMDHIFDHQFIKKGLRMLGGGFSLAASLYGGWIVYKNRRRLFLNGGQEQGSMPACFFALLIIFLHVGFYSLFSTLPRYALPIAPLFLAMTGYWLQQFLVRNFSSTPWESKTASLSAVLKSG